MFLVYIIYSEAHDRFYVGQTKNFEERFKRHNSGFEKSTSPYIPWETKLLIEKPDRIQAMELEKKLKNLNKNRIIQFIEKYKKP